MLHTQTQFVRYVHSFYGAKGVYPLYKNKKPLTLAVIEASMERFNKAMQALGYDYCGDSIDREFMREEVLEPMGYEQYVNTTMLEKVIKRHVIKRRRAFN
jgi:hypothetical protein